MQRTIEYTSGVAGSTSILFFYIVTKRNHPGTSCRPHNRRQPVIVLIPEWIRIIAGSGPVIPIPLTDFPVVSEPRRISLHARLRRFHATSRTSPFFPLLAPGMAIGHATGSTRDALIPPFFWRPGINL